MIRLAIIAVFCCCLFNGFAQSTENSRGRDFMQQFQLSTVASLDSSLLSPADKARLISLQTDISPTALCAHGSDKDCSSPFSLSTGLKLTGVRLDKEHVKLDWETKTEVNSSYFVIELRSLNDTLRYDSIGYKAAHGNSTGKLRYSATDNNNLPVITYYRVKEVVQDGSFFYSNVVAIEGMTTRLTVLVAPNPCNAANAGFYISGTSLPTALWRITNSAGATVVNREISGLTGNNFVSLSSFQLQRGIYTVSVISGRENVSKRFIIL